MLFLRSSKLTPAPALPASLPLCCALVAATVYVRAQLKLSLSLSPVTLFSAWVCVCVNRWSFGLCKGFFWHCVHSALRVLFERSCVSPRACAPISSDLCSASACALLSQWVNSVSIASRAHLATDLSLSSSSSSPSCPRACAWKRQLTNSITISIAAPIRISFPPHTPRLFSIGN